MKLEYDLINGKTNTEPEFQKSAAPIHFENFTILQSITPEAQEIMSSVNPTHMETIISAFTNPKIMNGVPIKGFPYLLFNNTTEPHTLQFYIGKEALNCEFEFFIDDPSISLISDEIDIHIIEKDGSITNRTVIGSEVEKTADVSIRNILLEDGTYKLEYYIGENA